jgi:hypothetical protein
MIPYLRTLAGLAAGVLVMIYARPALGQAGLVYSYSPNGTLLAATATNSEPLIVAAPQPELIQPNSYATFSVVASGTGLTYQWLSNGVPILGATGDSLIVADVQLIGTNLGNFSVIIGNSYGSITSAPVALWPDSNGNGMPDWWEMKYFGNLNQPPLGDYDGDGVDNLDEYLEGTDPANAHSFDPRLYVQAAHGMVTLSPDLPYFTMGQLVTLTAIPDPGQEFVDWSGAVTGTKSTVSLFMGTNEYVTANFGFPLGLALDNTNLVWTTTGDELWYGEAEVSEDGVSAAQSGPIVSYFNGANFVGDQTSLQTTFYIEQPEHLSFWWDVSSEPPDGVTFSINSNVVATLSGQSVPWQFMQTNLPAGLYALNWTYSKGPVNIPNGIPYWDAAWVDEVSLVPSVPSQPSPPQLSIQTTTNGVLLYWSVPSVVFRLEQTVALAPADWATASNTTVNAVNGTNQALVSPVQQSLFYRLAYP